MITQTVNSENVKQEEIKTEERSCANCACCWVLEHPQNPMEKQSFCRRNTAIAQEIRVEIPRKLTNGTVAVDRNGKPIMEQGKQIVYLYPPTLPSMVCWDGWRPMGTLPGDTRWKMEGEIEAAMTRYMAALKNLQTDMEMDRLIRDNKDLDA